MAEYLQIEDLYGLIGASKVRDYFDDDMTGELGDTELAQVELVLTAAEAEVDSHLMRSFTKEQITELAEGDPALKRHAVWIAVQFASERRPEFVGAGGAGAYDKQYERAIEFCKNLIELCVSGTCDTRLDAADTADSRYPDVAFAAGVAVWVGVAGTAQAIDSFVGASTSSGAGDSLTAFAAGFGVWIGVAGVADACDSGLDYSFSADPFAAALSGIAGAFLSFGLTILSAIFGDQCLSRHKQLWYLCLILLRKCP